MFDLVIWPLVPPIHSSYYCHIDVALIAAAAADAFDVDTVAAVCCHSLAQ